MTDGYDRSRDVCLRGACFRVAGAEEGEILDWGTVVAIDRLFARPIAEQFPERILVCEKARAAQGEIR